MCPNRLRSARRLLFDRSGITVSPSKVNAGMSKPTTDPQRALRDAGHYLLLAYAIAWVILISMIKAGLGETWLNIGVAGPAFAAMILSRSESGWRLRFNFQRMIVFVALTVLCWISLSWHDQWKGSDSFALHLNLLLLIPSLVPAWVLSGVVSSDSGVRGLIGRLAHKPTLWSLSPLICWPAFLLVPAAISHVSHQPLILPGAAGAWPIVVAQGIAFLIYNILFVGVEEEPGWRGFMLDRLQMRFSPLTASLMVWLPWSLWHAPLDYYRPVRFTLVFWILLRLVMPIPMNILLAWFYNRAGRSVQATALFHASMNAFPFVLPYYQPAFALIFIFAGWAVVADRMWRRPSFEKPEPIAAVP